MVQQGETETSTELQQQQQQQHDAVYTKQVLQCLQLFYQKHDDRIKESHGISHAEAVYQHACEAIACHQPPPSPTTAMEIKVAALLHDVDDEKYFPKTKYRNACDIMEEANIPKLSQEQILAMIDLVSCSQNGNSVPDWIRTEHKYHLLIPRWSDRLEAVGAVGVIRCNQYSLEKGRPLCSKNAPRATTVEQVWALATPERFEAYQSNGGRSISSKLVVLDDDDDDDDDDMISHYYDKLLHVARPPPDIVRNAYLTERAAESSKELVEVCLRYGRTETVDEEYIQGLVKQYAHPKTDLNFLGR